MDFLQTHLEEKLKLLKVHYDLEKARLEGLSGFRPYLVLDPFLQLDKDIIRDEFYRNIINEINWCFSINAYSSTLIMIRKLFENFIKDLIRKQYHLQKEKRHLYWKGDIFLSFHQLITNLENNLVDFSHYSEKIDADLLTFLDSIRFRGNESTHTIEDSVTEESLNENRSQIIFYIKVLSRALQ